MTEIITPECPTCKVPAVETGISMYHCPQCGRDVDPTTPAVVTPAKSRRGGARPGTGPKPIRSTVRAGQIITVASTTPDGTRHAPQHATITHASKREIVIRRANGSVENIIL